MHNRRRVTFAAAGLAVVAVVALTAIAVGPLRSDEGEALLAAGDIASCAIDTDEATAALLDELPGTVVALGDTSYPDGTASEYRDCYGPTWGRHRDRTRPIPGNHEYRTPGAAGYFGYFGDAAGDRATGYYSFELGSWHVVALNTECDTVGGCDAGSPQVRWLADDLSRSDAVCTVALAHTPRFSSGPHGDARWLEPLWSLLYAEGVEMVLSGDDHHYERFEPLDPTGQPDPTAGIRQLIVGTGGIGLNRVVRRAPHSAVSEDGTHGVLELTLRRDGYDWRFVPIAGKTFRDSGAGSCHHGPAPASTVR